MRWMRSTAPAQIRSIACVPKDLAAAAAIATCRYDRFVGGTPDQAAERITQGENMNDTIKLLEAIGKDATLRHASPEELAAALKDAEASDGLREYAATGDGAALTTELGLVKMHGEHSSQTGAHEGDHDHDHHHHHHDDEDDGDGDGDGDDSGESPNDPDDTPPA